MNDLLSKKAIRLLEDNGYRYKKTQEVILFNRPLDYVGVIVFVFILLIVASPFFLFNTFLGYLTLALGIGGFVIRHKYYSKKMNFTVNLKTQKFDFLDNSIVLESQSLSYASKIILHSKYVSEYTSSFKSTSEEHLITIRIQLLSGSMFTLFRFHSDYEKPSDEVMEVYRLIKRLIRWTKKKEAQSKFHTPVS